MNDLISRSALIGALPIVTKDRKVSLFGVVFDFVDIICNAPSVDAVEVCRCKDCKHFDEHTSKCYLFCDNEYAVELEVESDHFCSYGERK